MRLQLALNVRNIGEAISYYSKLFNTPPHKQNEDYANFEIDNPPLKLVLIENPHANHRINHLVVELTQEEDLSAVSDRLDYLGISDIKEEESTCCYATQNKVWSKEPQGLNWEWYTITDDYPEVTVPSKVNEYCDVEPQTSECCN